MSNQITHDQWSAPGRDGYRRLVDHGLSFRLRVTHHGNGFCTTGAVEVRGGGGQYVSIGECEVRPAGFVEGVLADAAEIVERYLHGKGLITDRVMAHR